MGSSIRRVHLDRGDGVHWCYAKAKTIAVGGDTEANCQTCFAQREKAPGPNQMLVCSRCKEKKPGDAFYENPSKANGRHSYCIPCSSIVQSTGRKASRSKVRAREKRYIEKNPELRRTVAIRNARRNREEKPKAAYARDVVRNEVRRGRLKRMPCEVCGAAYVQGHHDDYNRPRVVRWLCPIHHTEWHQANGPGANIEGEPVLVGDYRKRTG